MELFIQGTLTNHDFIIHISCKFKLLFGTKTKKLPYKFMIFGQKLRQKIIYMLFVNSPWNSWTWHFMITVQICKLQSLCNYKTFRLFLISTTLLIQYLKTMHIVAEFLPWISGFCQRYYPGSIQRFLPTVA